MSTELPTCQQWGTQGCVKESKHDTCHIINSKGESAAKVDTTRGKRFNKGKPKLSLIPVKAQEEEAYVWMGGAEKYGPYNWQKGMPFTEVLDSLLRHVSAFAKGEDNDQETGRSHMAHVRCNAAMLIEYIQSRPEFDDRQGRGTK